MWESISDLSATALAAWYAAVVSTLGLGWEIYKYLQEGIELKISARGDMVAAGRGHPRSGERCVNVNIQHVSGPPTTVTHIGIRNFRSWWHKLITYDAPEWLRTGLEKINQSYGHDFAFMVASDLCEFPERLEVGDEWNCYIEQNEISDVVDMENTYIVVAHTLGDEEVLERINF